MSTELLSISLEEKKDMLKEYYIAYIDILGYRDFFNNRKEEVSLLLKAIKQTIKSIKGVIEILNNSPLLSDFLKFTPKIKMFSDNVLICLESYDSPSEIFRVLTFISLVADIQRLCISEFGLLIRGGITKGVLLFNDDFVFGEGIIEAVEMEENSITPRIVLSKKVLDFILKSHYITKDEINIFLQEYPVGNIHVENIEKFILRVKVENYIRIWSLSLIALDTDKTDILNCFYKPDFSNLMYVEEQINTVINYFKDEFLKKELPETFLSYDYIAMLKKVRNHLIEKVKKYGDYKDIENIKEAKIREKIIKKYLWQIFFYNFICFNNKLEKYILRVKSNVDGRFFTLIINIDDDDIPLRIVE